MPAGHDFNALLIGALYGELSAVEESRLQAHLAAHPADQQILRELTAIRAAIRDSAALAIVDPPQAISALLLQEAARRAPRQSTASAPAENSRWWRFLFSFLANPSLAAAAMAVLVVGVFGTMYLRDKHEVAESTRSAPSQPSLSEGAAAPAAAPLAKPDALAVATQPAPDAVDRGVASPSGNAAAAGSAGSGAGADLDSSYSVGLDSSPTPAYERKGELSRAGSPALAKPAAKAGYIDIAPSSELQLKDFDDEGVAEAAKRAPSRGVYAIKPASPADGDAGEAARDESNAQKRKAPAREQELADDLKLRGADKAAPAPESKQAKTRVPTKPARTPDPDFADSARSSSKSDSSGDLRQPAPAVVSATGSTATPAPGAAAVTRSGAAAPKNVQPRTAPATPSPTTTTPSSAPSSAPSGGLAKLAAEEQLESASITSASNDNWARAEHVRLVRLARANKCADAAAVARTLSERAPRYYQEQVASDRNLRACSAAIRDQLNLQSEQAKRKRNRADDARPAASTTKK